MTYVPPNPNGSATSANSSPVVIASDQSAIPVTVSGVATAANQSTEITSLQLLDDAVATTASAIPTKGFAASGTDGTNARILKTDTNGELQVDVLTLPTVTITANSSVNVAQIAGTTTSVGAGATDAGTQRVALVNEQVQDLNITGQATQTASGNNIVLAAAGTGSTDTTGYRTISIQIIPTGTVSSGVVTFEGSNDNTTFVAVPLYDEASLTANPISTVSPATGVNRYFAGPVHWRYFKARISTVIGGGGSIAAVTRLSQASFTPDQFTVTQATAANLNATITGVLTTVTPGTAATNLGKARDSAIGATDTGVAILGVRRDAPTAETPVAGDYVVPQISANGEQWVRSLVEVADDGAVTLGTQRGLMNAGVSVQTDGTDPTAVSAEGDAAIFRTDMNRILLVNQTHPRGTTVSADYASAQTNTSVIASPGASLSIYITDIQLSNGATAGNVTLLNGSAGTVLWEAYPAINGGAVLNLRQPIKLSAATALCITSTTVTTHSIFIGYYIAA